MKNKILTFMICCLAVIGLASCDESSKGYTSITYYPVFTLLGDATEIVPVGGTFTDPGVIVMEGEEDITATVEINSNVNTSKIGVYTVTYSAVNVDGFFGSVTRTVAVYDPEPTADISGTYYTAEGTYRLYGDDTTTPFVGYEMNLTQVAPGIYYCTDYFGGYYEQRAGYGSAYAMKGYLKLNADNSIDILSGNVAGWGNSYESLDNAKYDPENGEIYWELAYNEIMVFYITFEK